MKAWLGILLFHTLLVWSAWTAGNRGETSDGAFDPDVTAKARGSFASTNKQPGTLFPTPVLLVTPAALEFGRILTNTTATKTFLVENVGRGKVSGKATVSPPFKVVDGDTYSLTRNEKQVVTVVYAPKAYTGSNDVCTISFSGAGVAKATVIGTPVKARNSGNR